MKDEKQIQRNKQICNKLALFFADFPEWLENSLVEKQSYLQQEYDELFKGVNAGIYIPLWASVCKNGFLLDKTTLEIVKYYYAWGYTPKRIDGNPPDFIGEQFYFLHYLYDCAENAYIKNTDPSIYIENAITFTNLYLKETIEKVTEGIHKHAKSKVFFEIADRLELFLEKNNSETKNTINNSQNIEKHIAIKPLSAERLINTAGRNNCGGKCAIRVREQEGCILEINSGYGLIGEPIMRACARGMSYRETYMDARWRLRYPMKRIGERGEGKFKRISWEEAVKITAKEWIRIRNSYGVSSRYVNYSTGVSAAIRPNALARRLLAFDGGYLDFYNSYSSACATFTTPFIYGDDFSGNSFEDMLNTKLLILWGNNPKETVFGSERNYYLSKLREKGIPIIVIDPRESDTVRALHAEWIGIRPSTDGALADAMAYIIWTENLHNQTFMDTFCLGFDSEYLPKGISSEESYKSYLFGEKDGAHKNPEWAERITGIARKTIVNLARRYGESKPACILPGFGIQRTGNGEQNVRSLAMLCCLTGNVGISGGGSAGYGAVPKTFSPNYPILKNPYPGKIPSFLWTKAIHSAKEMSVENDGLQGVEKLSTNIKMIFNLAGNILINQHSDINAIVKLLKDDSLCEFILCSDVFMTPSARFADILLPAPSLFEDENIAKPWDFGDYLLFNNKVIEPVFDSRFEYQFFDDLAHELNLWDLWADGHKNYSEWLSTLYRESQKAEPELPDYESFKRAGGYYFKKRKPYIAYEKQINDFANNPFSTPSGKIEIFSERIYNLNRHNEIPPIPCYVPCPEGFGDSLSEKYPLQLIGWHTKRRTHSIHDKNPRLEKIDPQCLWINPFDAEKRNIQDGDVVEVYNDRGKIQISVYITKRIISGVVALSQGAWYNPNLEGTDVGGSINVLTSQRPTPFARGNPQHTNLVEVRLSAG